MIEKKCKICGRVFKAASSRTKYGACKCCSRKCADIGRRKKAMRICQQCGKEFKGYPSTAKRIGKKFCSRKCYANSKITKIKKTCLVCKKEFMVGLSKVHAGSGKHCSRECLRIAQVKRATITCLICNKKFKVIPSEVNRRKYCSRKCYGLSKKGKNSPLWTGGKTKKICPVCGKVFYAFKCLAERGEGIYCSQKCFGLAIKGENSPNWHGGIYNNPYPLIFNNQLRKQIREKYGYKCVQCGNNEKELGYRLHVHHIDYNKDNCSLDNLIPLCRTCHAQTNFKREDWIGYFKSKQKEMLYDCAR